MTSQPDFSEEEWELLREAPPTAGMIVLTAQSAGTFRESFAIGKAYGEARQQHGASELLDSIVNAKPKVDRGRFGSVDELRQHGLGGLRDAVALLETKATPPTRSRGSGASCLPWRTRSRTPTARTGRA
jgi:hypothetical protein